MPVGGWLFRQRTWLPVPLAIALLVLPPWSPRSGGLQAIGIVVVAAGEALRLWAVRQIGAISRTRSDRLGPVIDSGPFAYVRNPLYLANIALWVGFAVLAGLVWLAPIVIALLGFEYHAIARWEERLLETRRGDEYRAYAARVPRWIPAIDHRRGGSGSRTSPPVAFSWRETLFAERGTLIAIAAGLFLIWIR